jgi:prephenate dehydrogenase
MFGPDSGKDGVAGLPLVFTPIRCETELASTLKALFLSMDLKVLEMDCERHDREAAYSQGVTHFVGRVLDELHLAPTQLATVGYQRLMSIVEQTCNDPVVL